MPVGYEYGFMFHTIDLNQIGYMNSEVVELHHLMSTHLQLQLQLIQVPFKSQSLRTPVQDCGLHIVSFPDKRRGWLQFCGI